MDGWVYSRWMDPLDWSDRIVGWMDQMDRLDRMDLMG